MKCLIIICVTVAMAAAQRRPQPAFQPAPAQRLSARAAPPRASSSDQAAIVVRYDNDISPDGAYSYAYETDNGISAQAQGTPRDFGGNPPLVPVVSQGSYAYTSPEGQQVSISYIADENGYQPQGDALPTPPPVPEQIARALDWLARNAPAQKK